MIKTIKSKDTTKIIKTFEDACKYLGIAPTDIQLINNNNGLTSLERHLNAYAKLLIIIRALNDGWVADPTKKENWFVPYFYTPLADGGGFRLYFVTCYRSDDFVYVSVRLCFKDEKIATYCATHFVKLYEEYMMNS